MKRDVIYTNKEIDEFLIRADSDIIININEENMLGEDIPFAEFFRKYQKKHLRKYGKTLPLKG
jgi:hypothetical protein